MVDEITNAVGNVSVDVIVQAFITLLLTVAVIALVVLNRGVPDFIMTAWLVSLGVWIPVPINRNG